MYSASRPRLIGPCGVNAMQIERLGSGGASEASLQAFERQIGYSLPDDYRHFLATENGGKPSQRVFGFRTKDGEETSAIRAFFTLDLASKHYFIQDRIATYKERLPSGLLPIACDSFGNLVLLDIGAKAVGSIYFWDHERESMDDPTWDNISFVASTFTELVSLLHLRLAL